MYEPLSPPGERPLNIYREFLEAMAIAIWINSLQEGSGIITSAPKSSVVLHFMWEDAQERWKTSCSCLGWQRSLLLCYYCDERNSKPQRESQADGPIPGCFTSVFRPWASSVMCWLWRKFSDQVPKYKTCIILIYFHLFIFFSLTASLPPCVFRCIGLCGKAAGWICSLNLVATFLSYFSEVESCSVSKCCWLSLPQNSPPSCYLHKGALFLRVALFFPRVAECQRRWHVA